MLCADVIIYIDINTSILTHHNSRSDQVVPLDVLGVLGSTKRQEGEEQAVKMVPKMTLRTWVGQLLSRSLLLGSLAVGLSMHE